MIFAVYYFSLSVKLHTQSPVSLNIIIVPDRFRRGVGTEQISLDTRRCSQDFMAVDM